MLAAFRVSTLTLHVMLSAMVRARLMVLALVLCTACKGQGGDPGPATITRTLTQDRNGNIWIAAFDGIFRHDGTSFTNVTRGVSTARFFSVLEDKKGNFWFTSIGSGVYYYDGTSFRSFTTKDGLPSDRVAAVHEDQLGNVWFGTEGGLSRYDGKSFRNYTTKDGLPDDDVHWITEDRTGKLWLGTRGDACSYDGKTFASITNDGRSFTNVRAIVEDRKGNLWLGGADGLWRHDGVAFTRFTEDFVGYVYEDRQGNIWTSSQRGTDHRWALSRYDERSLSRAAPAAIEMTLGYEENRGMLFGILEANDGTIWFGALDGVYRYDGNTIKR